MHFTAKNHSAISDFIFLSHSLAPADILFLPGGPSLAPAQKAAELYHQGLAKLILPSGAMSKIDPSTRGSYPSEWAAMQDTLIQSGIPGTAILREDQATYTYENGLFSKAVLSNMHLTIQKAILVVKPVHSRRAYLYYASCFPEADIRVCHCDDPITATNWYQTQSGIDAVFQEISRIGAYQGELFKQQIK